MKVIAASIVATFFIMHFGTFVAYGAFAMLFGLEPPAAGSPLEFLLSVLVVKAGLATGFVLLLAKARETWISRWKLYAFLWWTMFAVIEVGQVLGPNYSTQEGIAGVLAELIYFPASAWVTVRILSRSSSR